VSRFADEIDERSGEIEYRSGEVFNDDVVQTVTFGYLINWWVSCCSEWCSVIHC